MLAYSVGSAQLVAPHLKRWLERQFAVDHIAGGDKNALPQRYVGVVENVAYPLLLTLNDKEAAATAIAGWIGLKTLTGWNAWQSETNAAGEKDEHHGRRRLYTFMLMNAWQLAVGAYAASLLTLTHRASPPSPSR